MILLCESCSSLPEKQRGRTLLRAGSGRNRQAIILLFLVSSTERMHLKVREIYGKQLIFWKMETGHVLDCCCSSSCCSASSCSSTVFGTMFDCCCSSSTSISFFLFLVPFGIGTVVKS